MPPHDSTILYVHSIKALSYYCLSRLVPDVVVPHISVSFPVDNVCSAALITIVENNEKGS